MRSGLRTTIVLVVALGMAGLASYGVYRAIKQIPVQRVEVPQVYAVVAAAPLPVGTVVAREQLKVIGWPGNNPVPGGFSDVEAVAGRGLVAPVVLNEPITEVKLAPRGVGGGLPPTIRVGMRALSVKVDEVIGVAGFVVPGTRVDVLVSVAGGGDTAARLIVGDVQVLSAGVAIDSNQAKNGAPIQASVVTLMVTPQDAERVTVAAAGGRIMLALRNPLDVQPVETPGIRMAALMGNPGAPPASKAPPAERPARPRSTGTAAAAPPPPPPPPSLSKIYTVEAIRAAKRTEERVQTDDTPEQPAQPGR